MRIACWMPKAAKHTHTHTGCVILIVFPLQQWLHEHTSVLCYTYIACLVHYCLCWVVGIALPHVANGVDVVIRHGECRQYTYWLKKERWRPTRAGYAAWNFGSRFTTWHRTNVSHCEVSYVVSDCDGFLWLDDRRTEVIVHSKIERTGGNWI